MMKFTLFPNLNVLSNQIQHTEIAKYFTQHYTIHAIIKVEITNQIIKIIIK